MEIWSEVPDFIITNFYGASIIALMKKDGGICTITVGYTLRSLASKGRVKALSWRLGKELRTIQQ